MTNESPSPPDRAFIALEDKLEIEHWMMTFGCTRDQLVEAVRAVGNTAENVRSYLNGPLPCN